MRKKVLPFLFFVIFGLAYLLIPDDHGDNIEKKTVAIVSIISLIIGLHSVSNKFFSRFFQKKVFVQTMNRDGLMETDIDYDQYTDEAI